MQTTTSRDGTAIAYETTGTGPPVVLVDGAFGHRGFGPDCTLGPLLSDSFTVFRYDRRGRGDSGDTAPFTAQREIEDLDAVVGAAGGSAFVYGISSGAALALEAARQGVATTRLAVFEPPFMIDGSHAMPAADLGEQIHDLVEQGQRTKAVRLFLRRGPGLPAPIVALMRFRAAWPHMTATVHTLPYDIAVIGDTQQGTPIAADRWAPVRQPVQVLVGGRSPAWTHTAMRSPADTLPDARHRVLERQMHVVDGAAVAPPLIEFYREG